MGTVNVTQENLDSLIEAINNREKTSSLDAKLDAIITVTDSPVLAVPSSVNEGSTGNIINITNYDSLATYTFGTDVGTINYISGSTATFTAKGVTDGNDDIGVITCSATKAGELRSELASYSITVVYVPMEADTAYQVVDFTGQASLNDGFDLI